MLLILTYLFVVSYILCTGSMSGKASDQSTGDLKENWNLNIESWFRLWGISADFILRTQISRVIKMFVNYFGISYLPKKLFFILDYISEVRLLQCLLLISNFCSLPNELRIIIICLDLNSFFYVKYAASVKITQLQIEISCVVIHSK